MNKEKCEDCPQHPVMIEKVKNAEEKIEEHGKVLYGENQDGLTYQQRNYLTKKTVYAFIGSTLVIILMAFVTVNKMWADTRDLPETKQKVEKHGLDLIELKKDIEKEKEKIVKLEKYLETQEKQSAKIDAIYDVIIKEKAKTN